MKQRKTRTLADHVPKGGNKVKKLREYKSRLLEVIKAEGGIDIEFKKFTDKEKLVTYKQYVEVPYLLSKITNRQVDLWIDALSLYYVLDLTHKVTCPPLVKSGYITCELSTKKELCRYAHSQEEYDYLTELYKIGHESSIKYDTTKKARRSCFNKSKN